MSPQSRPLALVSLVLLVCSIFMVAAEPPPAHAQAVITVNTTRDLTGTACGVFTTVARPQYTQYCSLRQAINQAIAGGGNATINFAIPAFDATFSEQMPGFDITTSTWTIVLGFIDPTVTPVGSPGNPLPLINQPNIYIAGDTQATFSGISQVGPQIFIDGLNEDQQGGIVVSNTSNVTIERLGIINFGGSPAIPGDLEGVGIELFDTTNSSVIGCYIGVGQDGITPKPNDAAGILIQDGSNNTIGGNNSDNDKYNVISGNTNDGILIRQGATNMVVIGNRIGVNTVGNVAIPNGQNGIQIEQQATQNRIGSLENQSESDETLRNTIAGNGGYGIFIDRTSDNFIYGNWIGADNFFNARLPNKLGGIWIYSTDSEQASRNLIGGSTGKSRNTISGNNGPGVRIEGELSFDNVIANNYIGIGFSNSVPVSNTIGVIIQGGGDRNIVGGNGVLTRDNYIGGNSFEGVVIYGLGTGVNNTYEAANNVVSGNRLGVRPGGNPGANGSSGVFVGGNTRLTVVGGPTLNHRNIISNNGGDGITVSGSNIITPTIGTNTITLNTLDGVYIDGFSNNVSGATITGVDSANPNQIAMNGESGIQMADAQLTTIRFNTINQNGEGGIQASTTLSNTIEINTVNQNTGTGILLNLSNNNQLTENIITLNTLNGLQASGSIRTFVQTGHQINRNGGTGVLVDSGSRHFTLDSADVLTSTLAGLTINSSSYVTATSNILRANTGGGVTMGGSLNRVQLFSNEVFSNGSHGLLVTSVAPTTGITLTGNLFKQNTGSGIRVTGDMPPVGNLVNMRINSNSIISNTVNGIQLGDGGAANPQRVRIFGNGITGNGIPAAGPFPVSPAFYGRGIVFNPETIGSPGVATNPNHDIDPPIEAQLTMTQEGILNGRVLADGSNAACMPVQSCLVHVYATNPTSRDGQGLNPLGLPETMSASGMFTMTLGSIPSQVALTATDGMSNTSKFALFTPAPSIDIGPPRFGTASPGEVITYTHRVTNTGNIKFTSLSLTALSSKGWTATPFPQGLFTLAPGESKPVTLTLKLPTGANPAVAAGTIDETALTVSSGVTPNASATKTVTDTTTVLEKVVLDISPAAQNGSGPPLTVVPYLHTITNNGNTPATVNLSVATTVGGAPAPTWTTELTPTTITLAPGASQSVAIRVTVSSGSTAGPPPTVAQTTLTATPVGYPSETKTAVDTTTTSLVQIATLVPDRQGDAGATETISFRHTVTNNSNGTATFKLVAGSSLGSTFTFTSDTPGIPIVNGNTFTLSNAPGANTFNFFINITVQRSALVRQKDLITIVLQDANGGVIGGASVQDTINITRGVMFPRIYLPLVRKP